MVHCCCMSRRFLIIKTGETMSEVAARFGDYEDWFARGLRFERQLVDVADVRHGALLPPIEELLGAYCGVLITGSSAMVTEREEWSVRTGTWLEAALGKIPVLGVCYGHQLIGDVLGGKVGTNPAGREIGTI